ncbi:hypothetical protein [Bacteroides xylanisolvens]|nr:hypothetical protein [Bacteroides xylanisolvens]
MKSNCLITDDSSRLSSQLQSANQTTIVVRIAGYRQPTRIL